MTNFSAGYVWGMMAGLIMVRILLRALRELLEWRIEQRRQLAARAVAPPEVWEVLAAANAITRQAAQDATG